MKKSIRKIASILITVVVSLAFLTPAIAADYNVLPDVTVTIPGTNGLEAALTNVADVYFYEAYTSDSSDELTEEYYFFYSPDSTCTLNVNIVLYPKEPWTIADDDVQDDTLIPAGTAASITDKSITEILYDNNLVILFLPIEDIDELEDELFPISDLVAADPDPDPEPDPEPAPASIARPTASTVLVNGDPVEFDAYNINGNNYFKLRDLAYTLSDTEKQFEIGWDGENNTISLTSGKPYTAVGGEMTSKGADDKIPTPTSSTIYLDGKSVTFIAYNIDGNNYFKLRDIGQAFDFGVIWDGEHDTVVIDTDTGYVPE